MVFLGALVGIVFGIFSGLFLIALTFPGAAAIGFLAPLLAWIVPIASALPALPSIIDFLLWYVVNCLVFWLLAIGAQASVTFPAGVMRILFTTTQNFYRGFGYGVAATINLAIYLSFFANPVLLILGFASLLPILSVFNAVRLNTFYQGLIGWMCWLLPVHWLGNIVGLVLFIVFFPFALSSFGFGAFRFDLTSGTLESRVPMSGTAFNIANFTFLNGNNPAIVPGNFLAANVSSHEVGHNMNSAAMTPFYSVGTVIEENRVFGGADQRAISQMAAESRGAPRGTRRFSPTWSP